MITGVWEWGPIQIRAKVRSQGTENQGYPDICIPSDIQRPPPPIIDQSRLQELRWTERSRAVRLKWYKENTY